jgi:hypothetical protein
VSESLFLNVILLTKARARAIPSLGKVFARGLTEGESINPSLHNTGNRTPREGIEIGYLFLRQQIIRQLLKLADKLCIMLAGTRAAKTGVDLAHIAAFINNNSSRETYNFC